MAKKKKQTPLFSWDNVFLAISLFILTFIILRLFVLVVWKGTTGEQKKPSAINNGQENVVASLLTSSKALENNFTVAAGELTTCNDIVDVTATEEDVENQLKRAMRTLETLETYQKHQKEPTLSDKIQKQKLRVKQLEKLKGELI